MKKKNSSRDNLNLFFSAFLVVAYIVCANFFIEFADSLTGMLQSAVMSAIFVVFGLLVFYATRVGDGLAIKRLSIITLVLLVLPALYVVAAYIVPQLPLHKVLVERKFVVMLSAIALGYGIPYSFLSGFEMAVENVVEPEVADDKKFEEEMFGTEEAVEEPEEVVDGFSAEDDTEQE